MDVIFNNIMLEGFNDLFFYLYGTISYEKYM